MSGPNERPASRVLDLGAGRRPRTPGTVAVDRAAATRPDVVCDLDARPWPFRTSAFDRVLCFDVIEHLRDVVGAMEEIHRVARPGATVHITTPHFSCANTFTDPTHLHHLGYFSFDYFTDTHELSYYTDARFRTLRRRIQFQPRFSNRLVSWFANRHPRTYEERLAWVLPAWFLSFELEVVK